MTSVWLTPRLTRGIACIGFAQIVNYGVLFYTLALIGPHIAKETGWSDGFVYAGFAVASAFTGLFSPVAGRLLDRYGGVLVMVSGTLVSAAGAALLASTTTKTAYLAAWSVMGIGMSACLYDSAFASLARLAGPATRKAISSMTLIAGFSSTLVWPLTAALLTRTDWRGVVWTDMMALLLISLPLLAIGCREDAGPPSPILADLEAPIDPDPADTPAALLPEARFLPAMLLFSLVLTAHGFVINALSVHIITLFERLGTGPGAAILAGALIGPSQVAARLTELLFGKRLSPTGLGIVSTFLLPIALLILLLPVISMGTAVAFGLVYGASAGLSTIVRGVIPYALFGPSGFGRRLGLIASPSLVVKAIAPASLALVMSMAGPEGAVLFLLGAGLVCALSMAALALYVRRYAERPARDPNHSPDLI